MLSLGCVAVAQAEEPRAMDRTRLEALVDRSAREAMASEHIAGMAVAVVDRSGPLLVKGYGLAGHDSDVDASTLFRVGSISKTITWIAIMQLIEQGKLGLDDPIDEHLPDAIRVPPEGFEQPIRVRDLMGHTAGFEDVMFGVNMTLDVSRIQSPGDYLERYRAHRVREPGQIAVYCGYCTLLAGAIIEHESGRSFVDYVERSILRRLGMASATFREPYPAALTAKGFPAPMPPAIAARVSSGFRYTKGRGFQEQQWEFTPQIAPAAALSASAQDMAAYLHALLVPEIFERAGVLRAKTVLAMREPLFSNDPRLGANRHGFWSYRVPTGATAFGHEGGTAFQHAFLLVDPDDAVGIFVAENTENADFWPHAVWTELPLQIIGELVDRVPVVRAAAGDVSGAAGCYRPLRRPYSHTDQALYKLAVRCVSLLPDGDVIRDDNPALRYVPIGHGVYATPDLRDEIAFGRLGGQRYLYDFQSSSPQEKVGFLQTPGWFGLSALTVLLIGLWRALAASVRLARGREGLCLLVIDGVSLLWMVATGTLLYAIGQWTNASRVLLGYPGRLFPAACWMLLAAAVATALAMVLVTFVMRSPGGWRWWRKLDAGVTLLVLGIFALTLLSFGFLGYTGW